MTVYTCSRCKDTGRVKDDASWGENGGCTYVCDCVYGRLQYHNPLPQRPTDIDHEERARREHPELFEIDYDRSQRRQCPTCDKWTDDFDEGFYRCRPCHTKVEAKLAVSRAKWSEKHGITLQTPNRNKEQETTNA